MVNGESLQNSFQKIKIFWTQYKNYNLYLKLCETENIQTLIYEAAG